MLQTDASDCNIGAVLVQNIDSVEYVIAYDGRVLTNAERKYSVTEKECPAVIWSIEKF